MNDLQVALIAAAITCGPTASASQVKDLAEIYVTWLINGGRG